ncbi:hypothetical protein FB99_19720 [Pantoea agglomerans]|nr:hypothetical protein FB99_19720 [Pantoea agglomerans]
MKTQFFQRRIIKPAIRLTSMITRLGEANGHPINRYAISTGCDARLFHAVAKQSLRQRPHF